MPRKKSLSTRFGSTIDAVINAVSPNWGAKRLASRMALKNLDRISQSSFGVRGGRGDGYDGARNDRIRGQAWLASEMSDDAMIEDDSYDLILRCKELYRNSPFARSAAECRVSAEVGSGIRPQARVQPLDGSITKDQSEEINLQIEREMAAWSCGGIDSSRQFSLFQTQREMVRSLCYGGDIFLQLGNSRPSRAQTGKDYLTMTVDVISPERVCTPPEKMADPNVRMGIETYKGTDVIKGYWVRTTHPGETGVYFQYKWNFISRYDAAGQPRMIHYFDASFPGQTRGTPWFTPAMVRLKDLDDFFEAELVAKQIEACFGLIFTNSPESSMSPSEVAIGASSETANDGRRLEDIRPGIIHYAGQDETVTTVSPDRPGANFSPFVEKTLRSIAGALDIAYESLAKDFFRTTFSSGQLAMLDARRATLARRGAVVEHCLSPVYHRFLYELVIANEVNGLIDVLNYRDNQDMYQMHVWHGPGFGFINPRDEVKAQSEALDIDATTLSDIYAEKGEDVDEKLSRRKAEKLRLTEDDVEVRKYQWELESTAGLPHKEEQGQDEEQLVEAQV